MWSTPHKANEEKLRVIEMAQQEKHLPHKPEFDTQNSH